MYVYIYKSYFKVAYENRQTFFQKSFTSIVSFYEDVQLTAFDFGVGHTAVPY